ncbi:sigma-54-dependent Fis family transcriptional regulator [Mucilaginibacter celer]|uniref:AAA family ATPase n=1 Tax=Mucilaginibacter celer TaxID=2305508 RepID=A0A494VLG8_9SPHI|nr:sigma 54-interacting transcriptional regulator [Mucilaginibacter celer]AYL95374.1 AAA family ATPase [Mucilaginibacter celer]
MPDTDNVISAYPSKIKDLSTLFNEHFECIDGLAEKFKAALKEHIVSDFFQGDEDEKTILLDLSNQIAAIKNKDDLFGVVHASLETLFNVQGFAIIVVNKTNNIHRVYEFGQETYHPNGKSLNDTAFETVSISKSVLMQLAAISGPVVIELAEAIDLFPDMAYLHTCKNKGVDKFAVITLEAAGDILGYLLLTTELLATEALRINLLAGVCSQLSIALSNIILIEEVLRWRNEMELLLSVNTAIASVRSTEELAKVIKDQLKQLLGCSHTLIAVRDANKHTVSAFLLDEDARAKAHPAYSDAKDGQYPLNDSVLQQAMNSDLPVWFDLDELVSQPDVPLYIKINHESGLKELIICRFSKGEDVFGFWLLYFEEKQLITESKLKLIQSLSYQLCISVANIIANQEIDRYKRQLEEETIYLKEEIEVNQNYAEIIGESPAMQRTFRLVTQVSRSDSTVLILGETGTGKELIARAIHNNSPRKNKLMVKVNCAALPANLIESELFGHEKGSFTGATERRLGKFELANNGTLFLDEIGEMPLELQVKLLRALQEKEIERVGGRGTIKVDVRIIAATNRDLEKEVDEGRFRSDLYYRLNIFPIHLPALRDRKEDIPMLATHFIHRYSKKTGRQITTLGNKALQDMMHYSWPGNIRELEHLIERSILLSSGDALKQIHLPTTKPGHIITTTNWEVPLKTIDENECEHILRILKYCQGRISGQGGAADILGVPASTLNSKIKRLGIKKEHLV